MHSLRSKALHAYSTLRSGPGLIETQSSASHGESDRNFDEISLFGGQTRILVCEWLRTSTARATPPSPETGNQSSADATSSSSSREIGDIHPSLAQYLFHLAPLDATMANFNTWEAGALPPTQENFFSVGPSTNTERWSRSSASSFSQPPQDDTPPDLMQGNIGPVHSGDTQVPPIARQRAANAEWNILLSANSDISANNNLNQVDQRHSSFDSDLNTLQGPFPGFY